MKFIKEITFLLFTLTFAIPFNAQNRVALVIGNADYANIPKLENTISDAKIITDALKKVNFKVIYKENLNIDEFYKQFRLFLTAVNDSSCEAGFFYFAGHGIQFENKNFLVPIDAKLDNEEDIDRFCFPLEKLNKIVSSNNKVIITVLDACRNNPFGSSRSIGNGGLAKTNAVSGSLIAYSTEPGKVASDGKGMGNSVYSQTLARYITEPNLALEQVFKLVRTEVEQKTKNQQSPREESALKGEPFYFNKKTDFSKIDIKDIENEMNTLSLNKKYNEALLKGNILQNIYKERTDSISRLKYVNILISIAKINWQIVKDTIHPLESYQWVNYYKKASMALYDAIELFKKDELKTNQHKLLYSKLLINFINFQIVLSQDDQLGSFNKLDSLANELIKFNELYFGPNDYKTSVAYFQAGFLKKDTLPIDAFNKINKAYKVLNDFNISKNLKNNEDYVFDDANIIFYIIKWSLKSLNNLINLEPKSKENNNILFSNPTYLYKNTKDKIEKDLVYLKTKNHPKTNEYLFECAIFYNDYSLILNGKLKDKLIEEAIIISRKQLPYCKDYADSIIIYANQIRAFNNLLEYKTKEITSYVPDNECENIYAYINECMKLAYRNNDSYNILLSNTGLIYRFNSLSKYNKKYFNNENLYKALDKFNDGFSNIMADYKLSENKNDWNPNLDDYFNELRYYFSQHDSINYNYKLKEAEQYIEFASNCNIYGYGSPRHLAALEHYAVKLGESNKQGDHDESQNLYIKLINLNNQYSKNWTEKDIEYFTGKKNKDQGISILLSDLYFNLSNNIIDKARDINNRKDSILIHSNLKLTEDYKTIIPKYRLYN
jgi:hypothetical protein